MSSTLSYPDLFVLALALAADAFAVGLTIGIHHHKPRQIFRLAFHFGLFQALMPVLGVLAGGVLIQVVSGLDRYIAFVFLLFVGGKMLKESFDNNEEYPAQNHADPTRGVSLIGLSLAVSMDAFGSGVVLVTAHAPLLYSVILIGVVSVGATLVAMLLAARLHYLGKWAERFGGVLLVLIGFRILVMG